MLSLVVVAGVLGQLSATSDGGLTSAEVGDVFRFYGASLVSCGVDEPVELALKISPAGRATSLRTEKLADRIGCFEAIVGRWDFPIAQGETTVTGKWTKLEPFPAGPPRDAGLSQAQLDAVFAEAHTEDCFVDIPGLSEDTQTPMTLSLDVAPSGVVLAASVARGERPRAAHALEVGVARCAALHARTLRFPASREGTLVRVTWSRQPGERTKKTEQPRGLEKTDLKRVIDSHSSEVRFCYEKLLQDQPTLAGKLSVRWAIGPDGSVLGAAVVHDELDPAVAKCVVARVKRWEFPPPRGGGTVQVTFPWIFKRADE